MTHTHNEMYKIGQKVHFNMNDGHTYFMKNGEVHSCPTLIDGSLDIENEFDVLEDYVMPYDERVKLVNSMRAILT